MEEKRIHKKVIQQHLNRMLVEVKALLYVAFSFAALSLVVFIVQSWFIAKLFSQLISVSLQQTPFDKNIFFHGFWLIALCFLARPLLQYGREFCSQKASFLVRQRLQSRLLATVGRLGPGSKVFGTEGELGSKLTDLIDALDAYVARYYVQKLLVAFTPLTLAVVLFFHSRLVTLLFLLSVPLVLVFMILVGSAAAAKSRERFAALNQLSGHFLDLLRGLKTVIHLNASAKAKKIILDTAESYRKQTMEVLRLAFLSTGTLEFFSSLSIAAIALYLGLGLLRMWPGYTGIIMVPYQSALFVLLLAPEFYMPLKHLGSDYHAKAAAEGAMEELLPILECSAWIHPGTRQIEFKEPPSIIAEHLSILSNRDSLRLAPISFHIQSAERVLVKGASGVGKSSLFEALLTFIPYHGDIWIDKISLKSISRDSWQEYIGYLSQAPKIVNGTIAFNLRLASPIASNERLLEVLDAVGLKALVSQLPQQLNTLLGERGIGLSGGQLTRLAIAQLLLKPALVWLLDEPTEHLDKETAKTILDLLEKVTRNKTVMLISHHTEAVEWLTRTIYIGNKNV
ncbi:MAG: thiol reductant ABC exporter subunit CydD [Neisseriaceae bacterium]